MKINRGVSNEGGKEGLKDRLPDRGELLTYPRDHPPHEQSFLLEEAGEPRKGGLRVADGNTREVAEGHRPRLDLWLDLGVTPSKFADGASIRMVFSR